MMPPTRITGEGAMDNVRMYDFLSNRSYGFRSRLGDRDALTYKLYHSFELDEAYYYDRRDVGGVFNLEFSHDGRLLVAACELRQVLLFDAATQKQINKIDHAHKSCVNCVRFLDERTFATCSDDMSIKLWDVRNLKCCSKTLNGHSNWVKNIEYSEKENVMVTSAFDGSIYAWNLKCPKDNNMLYEKVFLMNGLMRTKLSPDGTKMVISTTSGYMIIIHDLHLETLATDLKAFRPNLYRLMQTSDQNFPIGSVFNYLFNPNRKKNRLEFIEDFHNDAEVISSLQIHPQGWCALSRNLDSTETEEWTTVHDIQKRSPEEYDDAYTDVEEEIAPPPPPPAEGGGGEDHSTARPTDLWMGFRENRDRHLQGMWDNYHLAMGILNSGLIGHNPYDAYFRRNPEQRGRIVKNVRRMTHYAREQSAGKGYIKELCFSADGRVIGSPCGRGVRLLGFSAEMQELSYCIPEEPRELATLLELRDVHRDVVVCCRFSPRHMQLVSGCLSGEIKWFQPVL